MADLSEKNSASTIKIVGADSSGVETYYVDVTNDGKIKTDATVTFSNAEPVLQGNGFVVATPKIIVSSPDVETDFFLIVNPNASGKTVKIYDIWELFFPEASAKWVQGRIYRDPTVTANGTSLTINKLLKTQSATSVASAYYSPTISARGTFMMNWTIVDGTFRFPFDAPINVTPNEKMLVTLETSTGNRKHAVQAFWFEE